MIHEIIKLQQEGSLDGARLITYMQTYTQDIYIKDRPCVVVLPGGGYHDLSTYREGEAMALRFNAMGYQAAVLEYSVAPAAFPTQILEIAEAVSILRAHAAEWHIDPDKILLCGSSAGGHAVASYGCFWHEDFVAEGIGVADKEMLRPNGMILCYPVITSGEFAHRGSFVNLCGDRYEELVDKMSLENQVNEYTPKAFIWHTFADNAVPMENALFFAGALRKQGIPFELHIYPEGGHGLAMADWTTQTGKGGALLPQCQSWIDLAKTWIEKL